jgi:hypothetical protein
MLFKVLKEHYMMQKRTLYSLLLISFIVVFGWSFAMANDVTIQSKNAFRCTNSLVNVTANVTSDSVSAIEIVLVVSKASGCAFFDSLTVAWDPAFTQLPDRVIDLTKVNGTDPDTIRFSAMRLQPGGSVLAAGPKVVAQLKFKTNDCCGGTVSIAGGEFTYPNPTSPIVTQFVDAATSQIVPAVVNAGTVTVTNSAPVLASIANATIHWGVLFSATASATDPDIATGCEAITYSKLAGPAAMTVGSSDGKIFWQTTAQDVCTSTIKIVATDKCGAADTVQFDICVQNTPPVAVCPANVSGWMGSTITAQVSGTDPDGGPGGLVYTLVSTTAPGGVTVNALTGLVTFVTQSTANYTGTFEICVKVADGAAACAPCSPSNADTCCFNVEVKSAAITIEKVHNVVWGTMTTVDITMLPGSFNNVPIGGYDLLIQYDNSVLTLMSATAGQFLIDCGWEYFTYRNGINGNCGGGGCPSGIIRLVAIAETNNGAAHPSCFVNTGSVSNQLAQLTFMVKADRNLECSFVPVNFIWYDCGDNALSTVRGDSLLISKSVWNWTGTSGGSDSYYEVTDFTLPFPNTTGATAPLCDVGTPGKPVPIRGIDFFNGGVDIICADSVDSRGDINLNSVAYEIADVVMFTNYFISGPGAFGSHVAGSMAASDVNADGLTLTVADLVYLIRVVVGDAQKIPKVVAEATALEANWTNTNGVLGVNSDAKMGGAFVVVSGNVTPSLTSNARNMGLSYNYDAENGQTRILVHPPISNDAVALEGFVGSFVNVGNAQIVSVELSTITGQRVVGHNVPTDFALAQNYPNPFNPATTIRFDIPKASAWTLSVYNVQGQVVQTYNGTADQAGNYSVVFDGANFASGMYFYRLNAGDFTSVKKMVMIK